MKKIILSLMLVLSLLLVACGGKEPEQEEQKNDNLEISLNEVLEKLYEGVEDFPLEYMDNFDTAADFTEFKEFNFDNNDELFNEWLGYKVSSSIFTEAKYEQVIISEPFNTSIPHSVVLIKLAEGEDVEAVKAEIITNADPRKWICVEAEMVVVENIGNVVLLVMSNSTATPIFQENFLNLKK